MDITGTVGSVRGWETSVNFTKLTDKKTLNGKGINMAKRFTDTNKYKSQFLRGLKGPYKVLWDYIQHDCDHAGIWIVDFEVAQIYIGRDLPVNEVEALDAFGEMIVIFDGGRQWWIPSFVEDQYGELNPDNRAHNSVIQRLRFVQEQGEQCSENKALKRVLEGCKDKDKDKDKNKEGVQGENLLGSGPRVDRSFSDGFVRFWDAYPVKKQKQRAWKVWKRLRLDSLVAEIVASVEAHERSKQWKDGFVPHPATFLNDGSWEDETGPESKDGGGNGLSEL